MMTFDSFIGVTVASLLEQLQAAGVTQRQLADEIGVAPPTITTWKNSNTIPASRFFRLVNVCAPHEINVPKHLFRWR